MGLPAVKLENGNYKCDRYFSDFEHFLLVTTDKLAACEKAIANYFD